MPIITFDDTLIKKKKPSVITFDESIKKPKVITFDEPTKPITPKVVTFEKPTVVPEREPLSAFKKAEEIKEAPPLKEELIAKAKRKGATVVKALGGDIPFARRLLPEQVKEFQPETRGEKTLFGLTRLGRDIGLIAGTGGVVGGISKIPKIAGAGRIISKLPIVGRGISKIAPLGREFIRGGIFGGITAGVEEPREIGKRAALVGGIFAAIPATLKGIGVVGRKALQTRIGQGIIRKLRGVVTPLKLKVRDLIFRRHGDIGVGQFESEQFVKRLEQTLTKEERELIPFLAEKTRVPEKLGRPDLIKLMKEKPVRDKLIQATKEVRDYLDDSHKFIVENFGKDVGFVEDYIPRIWDVPKAKVREVINWFVTRSPHLKQRVIPTIQEGVEKFNLKPKTLDIAQLIRTYDQFKIKMVANLKFADQLNKLGIIKRIDKAPADWIKLDHPALRRAMGIKAEEGLILHKLPVAVLPEVSQELNTIFQSPFSEPAIRAFETLNAVAKKLNLSISLFHHTALTETAVATGIGKDVARLWNPLRMIRAIKNKNYDIFAKEQVTKDGLRHGLQLGAISDVQRGLIANKLQRLSDITKATPVLGKLVRGVKNFNDIWDRTLWDYYHNGLKIYGYEKLTADALKKNPNIAPELVKREIASFVNDTFGGQAWDLLLVTPRFRQMAHWLLLAPDWTLSTIRQAVSPLGIPAVSEATRVLRRELGERFWHKAALYFWGGMNLLNRSISELYTGKGRWMWENTPGQETNLFIGLDEEGSEQYMRWGKQFRELPEFFLRPMKKFGAKLSPAIRQAVIQFTGSTVTGFPTDIKRTEGIPRLLARGKEVSRLFLPFSARTVIRARTPLGLAFPISRGITPFRAREMFKKAILAKDTPRIKRIWEGALRNNLDAQILFRQARSEIKTDITYGAKREARDIIKRLRRLGKEEGQKEFKRLKEAGKITPDMERQIIKLLKQKGEVAKQKRRMGIR